MKIYDLNYQENIKIKNNWFWYGLYKLQKLIPEIEIVHNVDNADFVWIENTPNKRASKLINNIKIINNKPHLINAGLEFENNNYSNLPKNCFVLDCNEHNKAIDFNLCKLSAWDDGKLIEKENAQYKFNFGFRRPDIHRNSLEKLIHNFSAIYYRCNSPKKTNFDYFINSKFSNLYQENNYHIFMNNIIGLNNLLPNEFINIYNKSFISIVCETHFWHNLCFDSEKIHRELSSGMIPIIFGPIKIVDKLKNQGFIFPENLWDHSYDKIIDPLERFDFLVNQLFFIQNIPNNEFEKWKKEFHKIGLLNHFTAKRNLENNVNNLKNYLKSML